MTDLTLFDPAPTDADGPTCAKCDRPARQGSVYCAGKACTNRDRVCPTCGSGFHMGVNGAGTKYCSSVCMLRRNNGTDAGAQPYTCAWCGATARRSQTVRAIWPYICLDCINPIRHLVDRLKNHRVPHEMARRLLADPGCDVCGRDIVVRATNDGRYIAGLTVDHDHRCCPGSHSCGQCVRGFLCPACNSAAGLLRDDSQIAAAMAAYLGTRP